MFLITGCGRSGTKYMAHALQEAGLDVGHERLGVDGTVDSLYCVDSLWYPGYHPQIRRPEFDVILHQVRHPLPTIGSLTTSRVDSWDFIAMHLGLSYEQDLVGRAAHYWYKWNLLAQEQAVISYRIENLENRWDEIMSIIGHDAPYSVCAQIPKDLNSREHVQVGWDDVVVSAPEIAGHLLDMAIGYGYISIRRRRI